MKKNIYYRKIQKNIFNIKEKIFSVYENTIFNLNSNNIRCLLLSSSGQSHGLMFPFHFYRRKLRKNHGLIFREKISDDLEQKLNDIENFTSGLVFIGLPLRAGGKILPKENVNRFFQKIKRNNDVKIIYFDISDQSISPHFESLKFVDMFLIHTVFNKKENYFKKYLGANQFGDYISRKFNIEPISENEYHHDLFYSEPCKDEMHKICSSWNFIFWKSLIKSFQNQGFRCERGGQRDIDVNSRFNAYSGWCKFHRMDAANRLNSLGASYQVIATEKKVDLDKYYDELRRSKIVFSPFGWGEVCPKDYEAVMKGCLLLKPSMEDVVCSPEFYIPYETYVPVSWDLSDLQRKVKYYLENDKERERIVNNACQRLENIFSEEIFLERIGEILKRLQ